MQILVLSTGLFYRRYGQQRYELNFLNACFGNGLDYSFRLILLNDFVLPHPWLNQSPRIRFSLCGKKLRILSKIKFVLLSFFYALKERPNFIICGHINLSFLTLIIARLLRTKYVILTHGTDVWNIKSGRKKMALKSALKIITVSRYTASKLRDQIALPPGRLVILGNCVDVQEFLPTPKSNDLIKKYNLSGQKILLTVARLDTADKDKGYDKVFIALPSILKVVPQVKYLLVGDGNDVPRIRRQVRKLGITQQVELCGYITDKELVNYYNLCDCYVMPSIQEGFGIVFLEAIACGKPVIAGNKDGSKDALLDGKAGILVDPDDIDGLSKAIIGILNQAAPKNILDPNYLRGIVLERFSLENFTENAKVIFSEIVNQL